MIKTTLTVQDQPVQTSGGKRSSEAGRGWLSRGPGSGTGSGWSEGAGWGNCRSCSYHCIWQRQEREKQKKKSDLQQISTGKSIFNLF